MSLDDDVYENYPYIPLQVIPIVDDTGTVVTILRDDPRVYLISEDEFEKAEEIEDEF